MMAQTLPINRDLCPSQQNNLVGGVFEKKKKSAALACKSCEWIVSSFYFSYGIVTDV